MAAGVRRLWVDAGRVPGCRDGGVPVTGVEQRCELRTAYRTVRARDDEGSPIEAMRIDAEAAVLAREIADLVASDDFEPARV